MARGELAPRLSLVSPKVFFLHSVTEGVMVHSTVAFGLLSWEDLISSDYRQFDFTDTI